MSDKYNWEYDIDSRTIPLTVGTGVSPLTVCGVSYDNYLKHIRVDVNGAVVYAAKLVKIRQLDAQATMPKVATSGSAGIDLYTLPQEDKLVHPGQTVRFRTGLAMELPEGTYGNIQPRSSAFYKGILVLGIIDSDFRGEVLLQIHNLSTEAFKVTSEKPLAQMIIDLCAKPQIEFVTELSETVRGEGGFGSTDKKE